MKPKTDLFMLLENMKWIKTINERIHKRETALYIIYMVVIGAVILAMNICTPLVYDDWHYRFIFGTTTPITSIGDIIESQYHHYWQFNGRVTSHFIVQFFAGLAGKNAFNIINTIAFILLIYLGTTTASSEKSQRYKLITLTATGLFLLMRDFKEHFLGICVACNYLWTAVMILLIFRLLKTDFKDWRYYPLLFIIGLICGWTNEGLTLGFSSGCFIYYYLNHRKLTASRIIILSGFFLGTLLILASPAAWGRALYGLNDGTKGIQFNLYSYWDTLKDLKVLSLFPMLLAALIAVCMIRKKFAFDFLHENIIWVTAILVSLAFVISVQHVFSRSVFGIELFSLILLLKLATRIKIPTIICTAWNICFCVFLFMAVNACRANYIIANDVIDKCQTIKSGENILWIKEYSNIPSKFHTYTFYVTWVNPSFEVIWYLQSIKHYYNDNMICLPKDLLKDIKLNPDHYRDFHTDNKLPFYVKRIANNTQVKSVKSHLRKIKVNEIPLYHRLIYKKMGRYTATEINRGWKEVEINGNKYLLVMKDELFDKRVLDISYE